jgi:serine/threonine protein kinase
MNGLGRPLSPSEQSDTILAEIIEELTNKFHAGESVEIERYIEAHPELAEQLRQLVPALRVLADLSQHANLGGDSTPDLSAARDPLEKLAEEFTARCLRGEQPSVTEYAQKYPELAPRIRELFPVLLIMEQVCSAKAAQAGPFGRSAGETSLLPKQLGDFSLIREVGRGGMGIVYEAEQVSLGRHVALKVLPQQVLPNTKQRQRFEREARSAARLHHTNIVPVFGVGEENGVHYYVMQYIHGLGLDAVLHELRGLRQVKGGEAVAGELRLPGPMGKNLPECRPGSSSPPQILSAENMARSLLTGVFEAPGAVSVNEASGEETASPAVSVFPEVGPSRTPVVSGSAVVLPSPGSSGRKSHEEPFWYSVARIGVQVAGALAYAHQQGVLHRDIKPANLLLDTQGTVWVTDFGLAKVEGQQNLTHTGDVVGTLRYLAPEAFNGAADAWSEVYALGLTLYELLALRPAFDETDRNRLIGQVTAGDLPRLDRLERGIPRDLVTIVHKAIDRDPEQRYPSAGEFAEDLQRFLEEIPIKARQTSVSEQFTRWCRRNKVIAGLTATVAALLVGGMIASLITAGYFRDLAAGEKAARKDALEAAATASAAQVTAEERRQELRRRLYISDMNLAPQLYGDGNIERLREVLDNHRPRSGESDLRGFEWFHWWRAAHMDVPIVPDKSRMFKGIAVSPNGQTVAAGYWQTGFLIYNSVTKKMTRGEGLNLLLNIRGSMPMAFVGAGAILVVGGSDNQLYRWEMAAEKRLPELTASEQGREIVALAASPSTPVLASADDQGKIILWNTDTWEPFPPLLAQGVVTSLAFAPAGDMLIAGMQSGQIARISGWTSKDALQIDFPATTTHAEQLPYQVEITGVAFCPDGSLFATGCADQRVLLWNARAFQPVHTFAVPAPVTCVAFSADGKYLAAGADKSNGIYLWDVLTVQRYE